MWGTRKIPAILVADIVGYSRLAGVDEDRTKGYFQGDIDAGQFARRMCKSGDYGRGFLCIGDWGLSTRR